MKVNYSGRQTRWVAFRGAMMVCCLFGMIVWDLDWTRAKLIETVEVVKIEKNRSSVASFDIQHVAAATRQRWDKADEKGSSADLLMEYSNKKKNIYFEPKIYARHLISSRSGLLDEIINNLERLPDHLTLCRADSGTKEAMMTSRITAIDFLEAVASLDDCTGPRRRALDALMKLVERPVLRMLSTEQARWVVAEKYDSMVALTRLNPFTPGPQRLTAPTPVLTTRRRPLLHLINTGWPPGVQ